jgi:hypothetical protein
MERRSKLFRVFHVNILQAWQIPEQVTSEVFEAIVERADDIPEFLTDCTGQSSDSG